MKYFIAVTLLLLPCAVSAAKTLSYDPPTEYEDGSPLALSDIREFQIFGSNVAGGPYELIATVPNDSVTATVQVAGGIQWFFVMRTVDTSGLSSINSNEVGRPASNPNPPVITVVLTIQVQ